MIEIRISFGEIENILLNPFLKPAFFLHFRETKTFGWEWICDIESQQCLRQAPGNSSTGASLTTCLMTCGAPQIWPMPTGTLTLGNKTFSFDFNQIKVQIVQAKHKLVRDLIRSCIKLFKKNVMLLSENILASFDPPEVVVSIAVHGSSSDVRFKLNIDESYRLFISRNSSGVYVSLHALTYLGARHGLETLLQLIWWDDDSKSLKIIDKAVIQDNPYYTYRGVHVDTARHFIPLEALKRTIEAMSMNKLNVFHWHLSDTHSFPFYSKKYEKMSQYGAYSDTEIYTQEDIKTISDYAEIRGVLVSVEIDTPGHAGYGWNFESDYGNLSLCLNFQPWDQYCGQPPCGQINPSNNHVYTILKDLYVEISKLTGEPEFLHVGGDGIDLRCWESSEEVTEMEIYHKKGILGVWEYYETELLDNLSIFKNASKNVIMWANSLTSGSSEYSYSSDCIVQSWGGSTWGETEKLVANNHRVIISHLDKWHLNLRPQWETVYNHRPWVDLDLSQRDLIIGGEVCVWTEKVDKHSLDSVIWPQASAFAERLWSDPEEQPTDIVMTRLNLHRERLLRRGIYASVLAPRWCLQNPSSCM